MATTIISVGVSIGIRSRISGGTSIHVRICTSVRARMSIRARIRIRVGIRMVRVCINFSTVIQSSISISIGIGITIRISIILVFGLVFV